MNKEQSKTKCYCYTPYCDCGPLEELKQKTTLEKVERMYNEEEVLELLRKAHFVEQNIEEWFEQFKKK